MRSKIISIIMTASLAAMMICPEQIYAYDSIQTIESQADADPFSDAAPQSEAETLYREFVDVELEGLRALFRANLPSFSFWGNGAYTDSELCVIILEAWNRGFSSFEELDENVTQAAQKLKELKDNPVYIGLQKQNKLIGLGAKPETDPADTFRIGGKDFIILDRTDSNGETMFFVMAKDYYGAKKIDMRADATYATAISKYDDNDRDNLAYYMTNEFAFNNFSSKLPEELFKHMDVMHLWNTEPCNYEGFTEETITIAPIALPSATEYKQYVSKIGVDASADGNGYWLRTSRSVGENGHYAHLAVGFAENGDTTNPGANGYYLVRPVFYLKDSFFRNEKLEKCGANIVKSLESLLTHEEVESIYTDEEIYEVFGENTIIPAPLNGDPVIGAEITADYTYEGTAELSSMSITWEMSDTPDGVYTEISEASGSKYIIGNECEGKYIRAVFRPVFNSVIYQNGSPAYSDPIGYVFGKGQIETAIAEINGADASSVKNMLEKYNVLFKFDFENDGFSQEAAGIFVKDGAETIDDIKELYHKSIALAGLNAADKSDAEDIKARAESSYLLGNREDYKKLSDSSLLLNEIAEELPYESISEFEKSMTETIALIRFNTSTREDIKELLSEYSELLDIDVSQLTDYQMGIVGTAVTGKQWESIDALSDAVSEAADEVRDTPVPTRRPVSGGGGNSGGGSGVSSPQVIPNIPMPSQTPEATETPDHGQDVEFNDIEKVQWAADAIMALASKNIINGTGDGEFEPNRAVTRNEFVKMIVCAFGLKADVKGIVYDDLDNADWSYPYAAVAQALGIVKGIDDRNFGNKMCITREDMAVISARLLEYLGINTDDTAVIFDDYDNISDYAEASVRRVCNAGIMNGTDDGAFDPKADTTRAMAAVVINRLLDACSGEE